MTADKPLQPVPKLRFPEFRNFSAWELKPLGTLGTFMRGLTYKSNDVTKEGLTVLRASNIQDERLVFDSDLVHIGKGCPPNLLLREGDVAICMSNGSKALVGKSAEYKGGYIGNVTVGAFCSIFRASLDFAKIVFKTPQYTDFIAREISGGNINNLKNSDLEAFKVPVPTDENEQQKIADCLGSLDDLIAAEGQKLEALRQYKQGLMQQLFPQPGETVPKLRFPEFRNAADWKTKVLGAQGGFLSSLTGKTAKDFDTGDAAFIPYMNVFSNAFTNTSDLRSVKVGSNESQNVVVKGDVFFTVSSETPEEAGMSSVLLEEIENCYLNSFCVLFRFDDGKSPNPVFLGYLLRSALARAHLSRGAQGATRYNISKKIFRSLPLQLPSGPEQQKIADCLGSLDDLIAAESQKLEALRQHKQGLMQQLFPSLEVYGQ